MPIHPSCKCKFPFVETSFTGQEKTLTVFTINTILFTNRSVDSNNAYFEDNDDLQLLCTRCGTVAKWTK